MVQAACPRNIEATWAGICARGRRQQFLSGLHVIRTSNEILPLIPYLSKLLSNIVRIRGYLCAMKMQADPPGTAK